MEAMKSSIRRPVWSSASTCSSPPSRQEPHEWDEVYIVLEGRGVLEVEDERIPLEEGRAIYVKAGAEHQFAGYEGLSVLVIFDKSQAR
jgi:mannose-6-phosphate isomerase-like protein (cupin superfamily)